MDKLPDFTKYSLEDLLSSLDRIDKDKYPDRVGLIKEELKARNYRPPVAKEVIVPGGMLVRAGAYIMDSIVLGIIFRIEFFVLKNTPILGDLFLKTEPGTIESHNIIGVIIGLCSFILTFGGYYYWGYKSANASIGKGIFGLEIQSLDGTKFQSFWKVVLREVFLKTVFLAFFGADAIVGAFRKDKRTLHDLVVFTKVTRRKTILVPA